MIFQDAPPPPPEPAVVRRWEGTQIMASRDAPMVLAKGPARENAMVRQALFVTAAITVVRPPGQVDATADRYRWSYKAYVQRQVCVSSIVGVFACTEPAVQPLGDKDEGEAPLPPEGNFPMAEAATRKMEVELKARAPALFEADRRAYVDPLLRAAAVTVQKAR